MTVSGTETAPKGTRVTPPGSDCRPGAHCLERCSLPPRQFWPLLYSGTLSGSSLVSPFCWATVPETHAGDTELFLTHLKDTGSQTAEPRAVCWEGG